MRPRILIAAGAVTLASGLAGAQAQERPAVVEDLLACRQIEASEARAACMESQLGAFEEALESGQIAVINRERVRAVEQESFGIALPNLSGLTSMFGGGGDRGEEAVAELPGGGEAIYSGRGHLEEMRDVPVRAMRETARDRVLVQFENGQIWLQIDNESVRITDEERRGLTASVRRGAMGSFFLKFNADPTAIRVRRVE